MKPGLDWYRDAAGKCRLVIDTRRMVHEAGFGLPPFTSPMKADGVLESVEAAIVDAQPLWMDPRGDGEKYTADDQGLARLRLHLIQWIRAQVEAHVSPFDALVERGPES